jgi:hypothetical protein
LILAIGEYAQRMTGPFGRSFSIAIPSGVLAGSLQPLRRPIRGGYREAVLKVGRRFSRKREPRGEGHVVNRKKTPRL